MLFMTKWQDLGTGLSPDGADLPPIVGRHESIRIARSREPLDYESPRRRYEGLDPGEDLRAALALEEEERRELFGKNDSRRARFMRSHDSGCCFIHGSAQWYPHKYALRSKLRESMMSSERG